MNVNMQNIVATPISVQLSSDDLSLHTLVVPSNHPILFAALKAYPYNSTVVHTWNSLVHDFSAVFFYISRKTS